MVAEWSKEGCGNWFQDALAGKDFYAMEKKRWEALHGVMTLAELYRATGRTEYYTALENIWRSIVRTDRHNDGGFSSSEGAVGDPYRLEPHRDMLYRGLDGPEHRLSQIEPYVLRSR